ncbi:MULTISPECIES: DUF6082 family protein [Streptomyces]|uniref:DUF6082 family protein n=1 Tax=Streptomyces TaxID=1883 RepID=UPI00116243D5|nr:MULTISPECIES: DUF6082 family protein [Streptomyces]MCX4615914.1 DUF6082 family protein [Streptomyces mirabilis]MCX5347311.1 DUF6082 family protein [Streptomyces mirabilis]QDN86019.1 hypothetical protein FNV61_10765 [Streptomyces sp. RLB3-6]QDO06830.1 hypothetical protein FNV68_11865 [Streptomyces sp. S1D4-23]
MRIRWLGWVIAGCLTALLFSLTPLLLTWLAPAGMDWSKLSAISQTYAAASIPMSAAALLGVVASLAYQGRQLKTENEEANRSAHRELILLSLNDEQLAECWEPPHAPITRKRYRQYTYINVILRSWHSEFLLKRLSVAHLQLISDRVMQGEIFREYWAAYRVGWREEARATGAASMRFVDKIDDAFQRAELDGPPVSFNDYFMPDGS